MKRTRQQGFSLLELVAVILILAIAAVPLFSLLSQPARSLLSNERIQTAAQLAQERAEYLLAVRRNSGYTAADVSTSPVVENLTGNYAAYTRTTTINDPYAGADCPGSCKQIIVNVSESAQTRAEIAFLLVNY
jgi:prepilin-type N-terminal cleavage/methylation domain-containing protein